MKRLRTHVKTVTLSRTEALITAARIAALAAAALGLNGCVFGNRIVQATNPDTISGYYATEAQTLQFFSTAGNQDSSADAPVSQIPSSLASVVTDPVWIQLQDPSTGAAQISGPGDTTQNLAVTFQSDNQTFGINGSYPAVTLWNNPGCTLQEYIEISGSIEPTNGTSSPASPTPSTTPPAPATPTVMTYLGSSYAISGRLSMDVWVEQRISGNCAGSLQEMSACYSDASQCGGSSAQENQADQQLVQALFSPYIQAGTLTVADIQTVSDIAFQVAYQ